MRQLDLWSCNGPPVSAAAPPPDAADPRALEEFLAARVGRAVRVFFTDNRSTMLSYGERWGVLRLRLHRMFAAAPPAVLEALGAYLAGDGAAGKAIDAFIAEHSAGVVREPRPIQPAGRFHDLQQILHELNGTFFHGASQARITWGAAGSRRRRRSIQLGCYVGQEKLIRIHPCLDQAFVPRQYVAWVVFHEMLHEVFGVEGPGRRSLHPPEFAALEETFPGYEQCKRWEHDNLHRLLTYQGTRRQPR